MMIKSFSASLVNPLIYKKRIWINLPSGDFCVKNAYHNIAKLTWCLIPVFGEAGGTSKFLLLTVLWLENEKKHPPNKTSQMQAHPRQWLLPNLFSTSREYVAHLFKDCAFVRALWFRLLNIRTDNIHLIDERDIIPYLLNAYRSNEGTQFVLKWLLMAESIWKLRNSIIFAGGSADIETISRVFMASIYSRCLGC